jgi:hypothetical protein
MWEVQMNKNNTFCGYSGFRLFVPGEHMVQFVVSNAKAFNLQGKYSLHDDQQYELPLRGYWGEEYKLWVTATQIKHLGVGIEVRGDFQKFLTSGDDETCFTWKQFAESVKNLMVVLPIENEVVHIINLKVGVDLNVPLHWKVTSSDIISNILRFKGKYNYRHDKDAGDKGYRVHFALAEYVYAISDMKLNEADSANATIRVDLEIKKSSYLKDRGITFLSDLMKPSNHLRLLNQVSELFDHLIIYQAEVDEKPLLSDKLVECWEYNRPQAWNKLHSEDPHKYKYMKAKLEEVIERFCAVSYKRELQKQIHELVAAVTQADVPDFPLYVEKREDTEASLSLAPTTIPFDIYLASIAS